MVNQINADSGIRRRSQTFRDLVFNTDQGSQFTSAAFTDVLLKAGVAISMDGKGPWRTTMS
jgi:transposase InsO family protein